MHNASLFLIIEKSRFIILPVYIVLTILSFSPYLFAAIPGESGSKENIECQGLYKKVAVSGVSYESFFMGYSGFRKICDSLHTSYRYLCIADFVKPSSERRFYVIDMNDSSVVHNEYVAHGRNSGMLYAQSFSNQMCSNQSSLGFYLISESYTGKHGLSIRLDGLDNGYNNLARSRAVVMHAADYAEPGFLAQYGRLGRSQGCPAMPMEGFKKLAPVIKGKSILFIYYPQEEYLKKSVWLPKVAATYISSAEK